MTLKIVNPVMPRLKGFSSSTTAANEVELRVLRYKIVGEGKDDVVR